MVYVKLDDATDLEVSFKEIAGLIFFTMLLPFEELTTPNSRVLIGLLVYLDGIVSTEEVDDEFAVVVILCL